MLFFEKKLINMQKSIILRLQSLCCGVIIHTIYYRLAKKQLCYTFFVQSILFAFPIKQAVIIRKERDYHHV